MNNTESNREYINSAINALSLILAYSVLNQNRHFPEVVDSVVEATEFLDSSMPYPDDSGFKFAVRHFRSHLETMQEHILSKGSPG